MDKSVLKNAVGDDGVPTTPTISWSTDAARLYSGCALPKRGRTEEVADGKFEEEVRGR